MALNPQIMTAVERLNYRVTVGDVATQAGLDISTAQRGLLALASEVSGNLQVSESGEIAYLFPKNFRNILRDKYLRVRLQEMGAAIWKVLFYLIRISFGIFLLLSIVIIFITIAVIVISIQSKQDDDSRDRNIRLPRLWSFTDLFWFFDFQPRAARSARLKAGRDPSELNFLESIFSFLFGDGNPNADLEERRWHTIGSVIRNHGGAVVAEQIVPYLDLPNLPEDDEYYMVPVLSHFDGQPQVSPQGEIVYHFPTLQATAEATRPQSVPAFLRELHWPFSQATSGQKITAIGLGLVNLVGALILGAMLWGEAAADIGTWIVFVQSIFGVLLGYGIAFLAIPLSRYFWLQHHNRQLAERNQTRERFAIALQPPSPHLQRKIRYAQQFADQAVVTPDNLAYTTEKDLLEQTFDRLQP